MFFGFNCPYIAVVINMFRLPDFLTSEMVVCHSLKLCKHDNRYVIFFIGKKLLARLDQAILEVIDKPEKTQQTTAIGTLF